MTHDEAMELARKYIAQYTGHDATVAQFHIGNMVSGVDIDVAVSKPKMSDYDALVGMLADVIKEVSS